MNNLTEQWKKDKLEFGKKYYVRFKDDEIDTAQWCYYTNQNKYGFDVDEVKEVLAPVPSYEEWKSLNEILDGSLQTNKALAHRLNLCKDLLKECREVLKIAKYGSLNNLTNSRYGVEYLLPQIDEVLK